MTAGEAFAGLPALAVASDDEIVDGQYGSLAAEIPPGQNYLWHTERYGGRDRLRVAQSVLDVPASARPQSSGVDTAGSARTVGRPVPLGERSTTAGVDRARRLRINEMLRLMSFPDDFVIEGRVQMSSASLATRSQWSSARPWFDP